MATLQKIRNKAGILVAIVIGLALIAFIMGDLFSSGPSVFEGKRLEVAEISGESVNFIDFNNKIERLTNFYQMNYQISSLNEEQTQMVREEAWRELIREMVLDKSIARLGINVSDEELVTMLQGDSIQTAGNNVMMNQPHPIIERMFTNPETGEFNRFQMVNYFNAITNPAYKEEKRRWIFIENQIVNERLAQKYFTLVQKGLNPSSLDALYYAAENSTVADFSFSYSNLNVIPDSDVSVSEKEIENYYKDYKKHFQQEEARSIEFVSFEIVPTEEDNLRAKEYIEQNYSSFSRSDNPVSYVNSYSDLPYRNVNYSYNDLPLAVRDSLYSAQPGTIVGPYFENESYQLAKLIETVMISDSVKARHILIAPAADRNEAQSKSIADSLKNAIDRGASFEQLARTFSADESNIEIGGDLGWFPEGAMVKPFSDASFAASKNEVFVVKTNFGFHVVRIDDLSPKVKKLKVAFLIKEVVPSDQTVAGFYAEAVEFRMAASDLEKFRQLCIEKNISPRFAADFGPSDNSLPGLNEAREIIRWAYESDENSVSQIFDLDERYIVAALTDVKEKGVAPLSKVKTEIETTLKKEKKLELLAQQVKEKISSAQTIEEAAKAMNTSIEEATQVRFSNPYVSGVGFEPVVIAHALSMNIGQLSAPVKGENGFLLLN
jgi:peptidyl-prolyl cis-trans isomerase D